MANNDTVKALREIATELRKVASSVKVAAPNAPVKELDPAKVRDFLLFCGGGKKNG